MAATDWRGCARRGMVGAIVATMLAACGGGGGGGGSTSGTGSGPAATVDANTPLQLTSANVASVSAASVMNAESVLKLGQHATTEIAALARNGTLQMTASCGAGGTAVYTLVDADANGIPSSGDTLRVVYTKCFSIYFDGVADGTMSVLLGGIGSDVVRGTASGTLTLDVAVALTDGSFGTWHGSLSFRHVVTPLLDQLAVTTAVADDLRRDVRVGASTSVDAYKGPLLTRNLIRTTARTTLDGVMGLASQRLGGRVDIAFDQQLGGYLGTQPDTGRTRLFGASNTAITLTPDAAGNGTWRAALDSNGDGVADSTTAIDGNALYLGYLWSETSFTSGVPAVRDDRYLLLLSAPMYLAGKPTDLDGPLRLQFSRPVAATTTFNARLIDKGDQSVAGSNGLRDDALPTSDTFVPLTVSNQGAAVLLQPPEPLKYGHSYQVLISPDENFGLLQPVTIQAAAGGAQVMLTNQVASFDSDPRMWAGVAGAGVRSVVMPGLPATLRATLPYATALPLRYQWTQTSGPAVSLSAPASPATVVSLSTATPGIAIVGLQLTTTDAIGRTSVTPVQVQTANLAAETSLLYFASQAGDYIGAGQTRAYSAQTGSFATSTGAGYLRIDYTDAAVAGVLWSLNISSASGGVPAVGSYTGAVNPWADRNGPGMNFGGNGRGCQASGSFQVRELEMDAGGNVQRLAVDFDQLCLDSNQTGHLRGSIRLRSSLPLVP